MSSEPFLPKRVLVISGSLLLLMVLARRVLAFAELLGVGGVPFLTASGLTIFQVQPLEPLETLAGTVLIYLGMEDTGAPGWLRHALILSFALEAWMLISGLLLVFQGAAQGGHVQVAFPREEVAGLAKAALTLRLATQTLAPAIVALVISVAAWRSSRRSQQPARASTQS